MGKRLCRHRFRRADRHRGGRSPQSTRPVLAPGNRQMDRPPGSGRNPRPRLGRAMAPPGPRCLPVSLRTPVDPAPSCQSSPAIRTCGGYRAGAAPAPVDQSDAGPAESGAGAGAQSPPGAETAAGAFRIGKRNVRCDGAPGTKPARREARQTTRCVRRRSWNPISSPKPASARSSASRGIPPGGNGSWESSRSSSHTSRNASART